MFEDDDFWVVWFWFFLLLLFLFGFFLREKVVRNESEIKASQAVGVRHHAGTWVWKGFLWHKQYWIQYTAAS